MRIHYEAISDQDTIFNLTNHSCFNLRGHQYPGQASEQELMFPSSHYIPCNSDFLPTGEILGVKGTTRDFRTPNPIGPSPL